MKKLLILFLVTVCTVSAYAYPRPDRFYRHWWLGGSVNRDGHQIFHNGRIVNGRAVKLVMQNGRPWVINRRGMIYQRRNGQWSLIPGSARDITVSGSGRVWVVGTASPDISGYPIYFWGRGKWRSVSGRAVRFVSRPNRPVKVINAQGMVFLWRSGTWNYLRTR